MIGLSAPIQHPAILWSWRLSWSRRFNEPIELPDGRKLKTLAEAMAWLAKEIPKSEHKTEKVQTAAHLVTRRMAFRLWSPICSGLPGGLRGRQLGGSIASGPMPTTSNCLPRQEQ